MLNIPVSLTGPTDAGSDVLMHCQRCPHIDPWVIFTTPIAIGDAAKALDEARCPGCGQSDETRTATVRPVEIQQP